VAGKKKTMRSRTVRKRSNFRIWSGICLSAATIVQTWPVLAYENKTVKEVAAWLNEKNIPFIPFSALDIRSRPIIREILAFLQFLDYPLDDLNFSVFLCGQLFQQRLQGDGCSLPPQVIQGVRPE